MIADNSCLMVTSSKPPSQAADPVMEPSLAQAPGSLHRFNWDTILLKLLSQIVFHFGR